MIPARYRSFLEKVPALGLIGNTPLLRVRVPELPDNGSEIWAKAEWMNPGGSIKDRPVLRMLLEAVLEGRLEGGRTAIDSSSGNAGIAYAMIGRALGVPVTLVVPANASKERKSRIQAHGASLVQTDALKGYDEALREAHRIAADTARYFQPDQYANDHNWKAHYETTAPEIWSQTQGSLTHFVAGLGTSGTFMGTSRRLKEYSPGIRLVSVQPDGPFHGLEGLKHMASAIVPGR